MRILLVEDDQRILNALGEALKDKHYIVDLASDGNRGWQFIFCTVRPRTVVRGI